MELVDAVYLAADNAEMSVKGEDIEPSGVESMARRRKTWTEIKAGELSEQLRF